MRHTLKYLVLLASAICMLILLWLKLDAPIGDFGNYYFGSLFYIDGHPFDLLYDPLSFNLLVRDYGFEGLFLNFGVFPPITALLFVPATVVSADTAKLIWNILSACLALISLFRLTRHLGLNPWYVPLVLLAFSVPLLSNFYQGQFYLVLLVLLIEGWIAYEKDQHWRSAIFWAAAAIIKVFPLMLVLLLLKHKAYKQIARFGMCAAVIFLVSLIFIPIDVWFNYGLNILPKIMEGKFSDPYSSTFQSMSILLQKAFVFDGTLNPEPFLQETWLFHWLDKVFKFGMLYLTWLFMSKSENRFEHFALLLMYAAVFNGYSTVYSLIILLPIALLAFQRNARSALVLIGLLVVAISLPVARFGALPLIFQFPRLWIMMAVFVLIVFQYNLTFNWRWGLSIVIIPLVFAALKPKTNSDSQLVSLDRPALLTANYHVNKEGLSVSTFDVNGIAKQHISLDITDIDSTSLTMDNGQITLNGVAITTSIDRKRKPILINHNTLYFLSDEGRGVGFFALRSMPLNVEE